MPDLQVRKIYKDGYTGKWLPAASVGFIDCTTALRVEFRERPKFDPGFYQSRDEPHTVRYFDTLVPGVELDEFARDWRPVDVLHRD